MPKIHEVFDEPNRNFRKKFVIKVSGYAGTGKTTLLAKIRKEMSHYTENDKYVAFLAYTGKAASVLKIKLDEQYVDLKSLDYVGTIHSFLYKPITKWDRLLKNYVVTGWKLKGEYELNSDLIIIDEGSMVSKQIWNDLNSLNIPIIIFGDNGQLPPIGDSFNLLSNPDFQLTEIHRQALNSPIIKLSQFVREYGYIPENRIFSKNVFKLSWDKQLCKDLFEKVEFDDENLITLCAFNTTRQHLNKKIRKKLGYDGDKPLPNERIICLQNYHSVGIMNGQIGTLIWEMPEEYDLSRITIKIDGQLEMTECTLSKKCFGQVTYSLYEDKPHRGSFRSLSSIEKAKIDYLSSRHLLPVCNFDYGYVTSVHKSQGSEWEKVLLFEQRTTKWNDEYYSRWLYTAVTRARSKLFIISDYWG